MAHGFSRGEPESPGRFVSPTSEEGGHPSFDGRSSVLAGSMRAGVVVWIAAAIVLTSAAPTLAASGLRGKIDAILARGKKSGVTLGVRVLAVPDGEVLYSAGADKSLKPASNMKLITSAAALDLLGPTFVYKTVLAKKEEDLLIVGSGDPATGDPRIASDRGEPITAIFHAWAKALKASGITEIGGKILFDDSVFEAQRTHPSWKPEELDSWYAAPVGGLNFNDNCIDAVVSPAKKPGAPAIIQLTPRTESVEIENFCKTGKGRPLIRRRPGQDVLVLTGRCSKKTSVAPVAVHDPGELFASACRMALVASGVRVGKVTRRVRVRNADGSLPSEWRVIGTHESTLPVVLKRCNKRSQNLFAECLLKTVGYYHGTAAGQKGLPLGSWTTGRAAIRRFLIKAGVEPYQCVIDDGSGLSHDNRLSAMHLTEVLRYMFAHPHKQIFLDSLAVSGRDGTIRRRMTDITGQVHAKTGYVSGVRTLSGYVCDDSRTHWACFAILVNGIRGSTRPYARIQDDVVRAIEASLATATAATK